MFPSQTTMRPHDNRTATCSMPPKVWKTEQELHIFLGRQTSRIPRHKLLCRLTASTSARFQKVLKVCKWRSFCRVNAVNGCIMQRFGWRGKRNFLNEHECWTLFWGLFNQQNIDIYIIMESCIQKDSDSNASRC